MSRRKDLPISDGKLRELYEDEMMSTRAIADWLKSQFGFDCSSRTVYERLRKSGADLRSLSRAAKLLAKQNPSLVINRTAAINQDERVVAARDGRKRWEQNNPAKVKATVCKMVRASGAARTQKKKASEVETSCWLCGKTMRLAASRLKPRLKQQGWDWQMGDCLPGEATLFCSIRCANRWRGHKTRNYTTANTGVRA